jgi:hypothetical protein
VDDLYTAGELVWVTVHGHCTVELTGYFEHLQRDPTRTYEAALVHLSLGFGDGAAQSTDSVRRARQRAQRAARN